MRRVLNKESGNANGIDIDDQYFEKEIKTPQLPRKNKNELISDGQAAMQKVNKKI
jgi:hypothetical protein